MNFFRSKKKQDDTHPHPAAPGSTPATNITTNTPPPSGSSQQYRAQRQSSVNGSITIPPRTNSAVAPNLSANQGPLQVPGQQQPGQQQQQQQQQFYQQQQQQQPQFFQQQQPPLQQHSPPLQQQQQQQQLGDPESIALNASLQQQQSQPQQIPLQQQQQQMQQQPMMQGMPSGSYTNESMLQSQALQYPSYQDQPNNNVNVMGMEGYDSGYAGGVPDDQLLAHHQLQQ
ncbi:hypothetical protein BX616_007482, partial [Lobosporangium transversale]